MTSIESELQKIRDRMELAHKHICDLAAGRRKWEMCIPVMPTDSDITLQAPLDDIAKLLECVEVLSDGLSLFKERTAWDSINLKEKDGVAVDALVEAQRILEEK